MAVTNSIIRIYGNADLTDLVTTVTDGPDTDLDVTGLLPGTKYWATAQVTADGLTSEESSPYIFYTLPYIEFTGTMHTGTDWFSSLLDHTTTDVGIARWGIAYSESSEFTDPVYVSVKPMPSQEVNVSGLEQNTTYYARAFVTDVFGRTWVNPNTVTVSTTAAAPTIEWHGMIAIGATSFDASIKVASDIALTSVVCTYTDGVTPVTVNLSAVTGVQSVNLTGLNTNTRYSVTCTATNASGSASTSAATFTTNALEVSVYIANLTVDNATNIINATSDVEYDHSIITITGHYIDLYENKEHRGTAFESVSGGANAVVNLNISHANTDETYYVFGRVTYTVSGYIEEYTAWSEPWEVLTYSLLSFGKIEVDNTDAKVDFSVVGATKSTVIEYSADGENWGKVPVKDPTGEKLYFTGLEPNTTYYLRGRTQSTAGWSGYATASFITGSQVATDIYITSITNMSTTNATIKLTIE